MQNNRRVARVYSFQFLYHLNFQEFSALKDKLLNSSERNEVLIMALNNFNGLYNPSELPQGENHDYSLKLINKVLENYPQLEEKVKSYSTKKMTHIDTTLLIQGACELLFFKQIPKNVIIDEAIEMAKLFSTKQSSSFINAVLDKISKEKHE